MTEYLLFFQNKMYEFESFPLIRFNFFANIMSGIVGLKIDFKKVSVANSRKSKNERIEISKD